MKWSWRLGRVAGIDIKMHWTFLLLLAWVAGAFLLQGESLLTAARGIAIVLSFFVCIVMHEYGHALTARRFGVDTQDITLLPIGGVARLEKFPKKPWEEFWIAVAGPAVNVAIAIVVAVILAAQGRLGQTPDVQSPTEFSYLHSLLFFNVIVVLFNMLPAFPMDGGRVLRAILASRGSYAKATRTAANVGQMVAILFGVIGLFAPNILLVFIAIFVYLGAEAEARMVEITAAIENVPVREAMMTCFRSLGPDDTLGDAAAALLAGAQQDFPVVQQGQLVGLLRRRDLIRAMHEASTHQRVGDAMETSFERASVDEMVEDVLMHMKRSGLNVMPVVRDSEIVGLLTLENIGELVMIRAAMQGDEAGPVDVRELTGAA